MSTRVKIIIVTKVITEVQLEDGETLQDLKNRKVDIYLHGQGEDGHINKVDLGGDATIEILK